MRTISDNGGQSKMTWFRFYHEALDDPKVQRLTPTLFKTWVNLLCLAARKEGNLPSVDDIAFSLRMSVNDAQQQIDELILVGLLDIDSKRHIAPHNWSARQYKSDTKTSAERTRKYRERLKKKSCDVTCDVTCDNAEQSRADTETEQSIAMEAVAVPSLTRMMIEKKCFEAAGGSINQMRLSSHNIDPIMGLIEGGYSLETDILPAIRAKAAKAAPGSINSWKLFALAVQDSVAGRKFGRELAAERPKPRLVEEGPKKTPQQIEADREKMFALDLSGYEEELGIGGRN